MKDAIKPRTSEKIIGDHLADRKLRRPGGKHHRAGHRPAGRRCHRLINYHFASKKNLIEVCVQRIISHAMGTFAAAEHATDTRSAAHRRQEGMASFTARVFAFLLHHPEIPNLHAGRPGAAGGQQLLRELSAILKAIPDANRKTLRKTRLSCYCPPFSPLF